MKQLMSVFFAITLVGCGGAETTSNVDQGHWYKPEVGVTWQWQLRQDEQHQLNISYDALLYDIDLFDNSTEVIQNLHARGKKVVCYFSAGSHEDWRDDAGDFASSELGNALDGWTGERWLDIRSENVRNIMAKRIQLARSKGCDAVEPDNIDGYTNNTGFGLTDVEQLDFNRYLASLAHANGLGIALKNDHDQIPQLVDDFDFAINEQCFEYDECEALSLFVQQGKAVLNAEYSTEYQLSNNQTSLCQKAAQLSFSTLVLPLDLDDSYRFSCSEVFTPK